MNKLQQTFYKNILSAGYSITDHFLLAVSGGIDSMTMLHIAHSLKLNISVAHCNYQLRGTDSPDDEKLVNEYCINNNLTFHHQRFDTKTFAEQNQLSVQMAARRLRYEWFNELMESFKYSAVLTAHHADDQAETVLLKLIRGSGPSSLSGIRIKNGNVFRPLLSISKISIKEYAAENNVQWREDKSNASSDYQRNIIRNEVMPLLENINPSVASSFVKLSAAIADADQFMRYTAAKYKEERIKSIDGKTFNVTITGLKGIPGYQTLLHLMMEQFNFPSELIPDLADATGHPGKTFSWQQWKLTTSSNSLIISSETESLSFHHVITEVPFEIRINDYIVTGEIISAADIGDQLKNPSHAFLDASDIKWPVVLRNRNEGDWFIPYGSDHRKKLSDFFTDLKLSIPDKNKVIIAESASNIIWVAGYRSDQRFRITDKTSAVLHLQISSPKNNKIHQDI